MKACWDHDPAQRPLFDQIIDLLTQFSFPLEVKPHYAVPGSNLEWPVVTFANLYRVLDVPTYKCIFSELDDRNRAALREVCKYWQGIVDTNFKRIEKVVIKDDQ